MEPAIPNREEHRGEADERRDSGVSLVEIVISIVLMGTVVVAILNATSSSIRTSSVSRDAAQVETVVVNAADRLNRAPIRCDIDGYTEYAVAAVRSQGWWTNEGEFARAAEVRHEFYDPTASPPWREGVCPVDDFGKRLIQRVTVTITSPERSVSRTIQVVKSDV
jgi:type II secretory pathway pseudopilin PulG